MIPDCRHGSCPNGCEPCSKPHHAISDFCVSIASQNSINSWIAGIVVGLGLHAIVKKYAFRPRLEDVTAHTLRHSFAKNLVDAGTPLDQVAILLGHESLDTTRIYTQPSGRDLERAVKRAAGEIIRDDG